MEQEIINEVQLATKEYQASAGFVQRIEHELLPHSEQVLKDTFRLYDRGEINLQVHLTGRGSITIPSGNTTVPSSGTDGACSL